jgi:hypothetical protein
LYFSFVASGRAKNVLAAARAASMRPRDAVVGDHREPEAGEGPPSLW